MNYYEIRQAIKNYALYAYSLGGMSTTDRVMTSCECAGFERIVNDYVDALQVLNTVRNENKKMCAYYDAIGYNQYQTADVLHITPSAVNQNLKWLKNFFAKVLNKSGGQNLSIRVERGNL